MGRHCLFQQRFPAGRRPRGRGRLRRSLRLHRGIGGARLLGQEDRAEQASQNHPVILRSEGHTSELQSLMRISYAVFCLKKKTTLSPTTTHLKLKSHTNTNKYVLLTITN